MYDAEIICSSCGKHFDYGERMYGARNGLYFCFSCVSRCKDNTKDKTVDEFATLLGLDIEVNS